MTHISNLILLISVMFGRSWNAYSTPIQYELVTNTNGNAQRYMDDWIDLSLECFRAYPYLYDGTRESEAEYFAFYSRQPNLVMVVAKDTDNRVIGVLAGMPLAEESANKTQPFITAKEDPSHYFYIAECAVNPAFRSQGVARTMYTLFEQHIGTLQPSYRYIAACGIERDNNPEWYIPEQQNPLYLLKKEYGWQRYPQVHTSCNWLEVGSESESTHTIVFWRKQLAS